MVRAQQEDALPLPSLPNYKNSDLSNFLDDEDRSLLHRNFSSDASLLDSDTLGLDFHTAPSSYYYSPEQENYAFLGPEGVLPVEDFLNDPPVFSEPLNLDANDCLIYPSRNVFWSSSVEEMETDSKDQVPSLSDAEVPESRCTDTETKPALHYTPDYDHSYFQTKSPVPSDSSDSSETSGEDVDIETIPEEDEEELRLCTIKLQRPSKQQFPLYSVQPAKRRRVGLRQQETNIMPKFSPPKRENRKNITRTKRGRRPVFSESSPCVGHANSIAEEPVKRKMHNSMERMRREELRKALHNFRGHVPELKHDQKAAKVKILERGTKYVRDLGGQTHSFEHTRKSLTDRNKFLRLKFSFLNK